MTAQLKPITGMRESAEEIFWRRTVRGNKWRRFNALRRRVVRMVSE
jgi:hypothetical protein